MEKAVFIGTFVPLILLLLLLRHSRPVFSFFCWGMASFMIVRLASPPLYQSLGLGDSLATTAVFVGPPIEELLKALPLFVAAFFVSRSFVPYFYIFGLASGIGFAIEENIIFLIQFHETESQSTTLMVLRSFSTCLMHGVATGFTGFMVTKAIRGGGMAKFVFPFVGIVGAAVYHGFFNWLMLQGHTAIGTGVAFGLFIAFLWAMKEIESWAPEIQGTTWQ